MIEARKERISELIRSLESLKMRSRAPWDEGCSFEGWSSSSTKTGAGKVRRLQPIPRAKRGDDI